MMQLRELLEILSAAQVQGALDVEIGGIECDSRRIGEGDLFVAIRGGEEQDRHQFIPEALARGARAIVAEESVDTGTATQVLVENCRQALAKLAAHYYNYPDRELLMVGITGTNGKTTTAFLVQQVLAAACVGCGYVGTLGGLVRDDLEKISNTTPEATELYRLLRDMVAAGKRAAVLEVSSHGLALERVAGIRFKAAIFTNLTRDHLDFHRTEQCYFAAKARLFEELDRTWGGKALINIDDPVAPILLERVDVPVLTFGCRPEAQVRLLEANPTDEGTLLHLQTPLGEIEVSSRLTGRFNSFNVLAAVACGLALEIEPEVICRGIAALDNVPGRFERIVAGQPFEVIVDYAHTPSALENVLAAARPLAPGHLICVFGCGGDRDSGKRPLMGRIAGELADRSIVTSDNPRTESPEKIIDEIVAGIGKGGEVRILSDRREAIQEALSAAVSGDVVVIAGKGHETGQILSDRVVDFDDRRVARQVLASLNGDRETRGHGN